MAETDSQTTKNKVWMPSQMISNSAPREAKEFTDVTGELWVRWWYPGFGNTGGSVSKKSFMAWVRRNAAKEV
jgi:hypothetical protein